MPGACTGRERAPSTPRTASSTWAASWRIRAASCLSRSPTTRAWPGEIPGTCPWPATAGGRDEPYSSRFRSTADHSIDAVGMPVTEHPPHRSRRARFTHRAPRAFTIRGSRLGASNFKATAAWQTWDSPVHPGNYLLTTGAASDSRASSSTSRRTASSRPAGSNESSARSIVAGRGP